MHLSVWMFFGAWLASGSGDVAVLLQREVRIASSTLSAGGICMWPGRAVPDVYVLGQQKAGTTTLAMDLFKSGLKSATGSAKELHLFDKVCGFLHDGPLSEELFFTGAAETCPKMTEAAIQQFLMHFSPCTHGGPSRADMTPLNLRLPGLPAALAELYKEAGASLKFIVALREPLARLQSGFYHSRRTGNSAMPVETLSEYLDMLRDRLPALERNGSLPKSYFADQFYRSMYGLNVAPWLGSFDPHQFAVIPMGAYFKSVDARRDAIGNLSKHFSLDLTASNVKEAEAHWTNEHPTLEQDLDQDTMEWWRRTYFRPDLRRLASSLASALPDGMAIIGYTGPPDVEQIMAYLTQNW